MLHAGSALADSACTPRILSMQAARAAEPANVRPAEGWVPVTLPETWSRRWPDLDGSVWYRIDWERGCQSHPGDHDDRPIALGIDGISSAGAVFINDDLLWSDASLVEPLSRSWNTPRWWLLPPSALHAGVNSIWVRAAGLAALSPGLSTVRLGDPATVAEQHAHSLWHQKTIYFINAVLCAMASVMFTLIWALRRQESAYGWFALMSLAWLVYLSTYLADSPWPFADSLMRSRASMVALILYVLSACLFTFRFGRQQLPRVEYLLWGLAALGSAISLLAPRASAGYWFGAVWQATMAVFLANALQFQWHAWQRQAGERSRRRMLLALVWLVFVAMALHDLSGSLGLWQVARNWAAMSGLLITSLIMLVLGTQLMEHMRSVEHFNRDLALSIALAREDLSQAQEREHAQALKNAKLQERMHIAHDLHDGLGASLVRSMALVQQSRDTLGNERVLSLFKTLRDDLRQVIDYGIDAAAASVPDTPVQWAAPLRRRFMHIFDEINMDCVWNITPQWLDTQLRPSALQCLGLARLLEEALSNIIKHSHATRLCVDCLQPAPDLFTIAILDNGVGFDVEAAQSSGTSVGMRSMLARTERMGGTLSVQSRPGHTEVKVTVPLTEPPRPDA